MQLLQEAHQVLLLGEAQLQVKLRELRLTVCPQILVPEAAGDLEITLEAGDHEELLELLRRLGQGVEVTPLQPAGHQVIARALRRRRRK